MAGGVVHADRLELGGDDEEDADEDDDTTAKEEEEDTKRAKSCCFLDIRPPVVLLQSGVDRKHTNGDMLRRQCPRDVVVLAVVLWCRYLHFAVRLGAMSVANVIVVLREFVVDVVAVVVVVVVVAVVVGCVPVAPFVVLVVLVPVRVVVVVAVAVVESASCPVVWFDLVRVAIVANRAVHQVFVPANIAMPWLVPWHYRHRTREFGESLWWWLWL